MGQAQQAGRKHFWTVERGMFTLLAFVLIAVIASSCDRGTANKTGDNAGATGAGTANKTQPGATTDASAPAGTTVPDEVLQAKLQGLDGENFSLADYKGKVVVLNFWATWCGPCRVEIPHFNELTSEHGAQDLQIIGLTTEEPESDGPLVRNFVKQMKINYKIGWSNTTLTSSLIDRDVIPQTFVFSREGRLIRHFEGFNPQTTPEQLRQTVERALNDKRGA